MMWERKTIGGRQVSCMMCVLCVVEVVVVCLSMSMQMTYMCTFHSAVHVVL